MEADFQRTTRVVGRVGLYVGALALLTSSWIVFPVMAAIPDDASSGQAVVEWYGWGGGAIIFLLTSLLLSAATFALSGVNLRRTGTWNWLGGTGLLLGLFATVGNALLFWLVTRGLF